MPQPWTDKDAYGLDTLTLPDGYRPLEVVSAIKCLTPDGSVVVCHRYSRTLGISDGLGLAHGLVITFSDLLRQVFHPTDAEPHEDPDA